MAKTLAEPKAETLLDTLCDVEAKALVDTSAKTIVQAKAQKLDNTLANTVVVYLTLTLKYADTLLISFLLVNCSLISLRSP